ncbi:MAG TPA: hypothetical protein VI968_01985 [archaeon]|nr:hypothetical protein [archaeon]
MEEIHPSVYVVAIIIAGLAILGAFFSTLLIAAAAIIMLATLLFFTKKNQETFEELRAERRRFANSLLSKIDSFASRLDATRIDLTRHVYGLQSRAFEREQETERNMREIAGKILQVENNLSEVKRRLRYEEV